MDPKKMKLILAVSVAVNIALIVIMLVLKNGYKDQAQEAYKVSTKTYTDQVASVVNAQNTFIKTGNALWQIIFETTAQNLSQAAFNARVAELDADELLNPQTTGNETTLSCGADCAVKFTFKNGKFVSVDYKALASISPAATFSVSKPAPFNFQAQ